MSPSLSPYGKHAADRVALVGRHSSFARVLVDAWSVLDDREPYPHHASITVPEVRRANQVLAQRVRGGTSR